MAKMVETNKHETFRDRSRREYEERRAEGRLLSARRTCLTLDEKDGKSVSRCHSVYVRCIIVSYASDPRQFNVLWLNPQLPESFPEGLLDALSEHTSIAIIPSTRDPTSVEARLRLQMQRDALRPLAEDDSEPIAGVSLYPSETIQEAVEFLQLSVRRSSFAMRGGS
jgi:hypothetical protein